MDSEPAFPGFQYTEGHGCAKRTAPNPDGSLGDWEEHHPGMSLRDYFAAKALRDMRGEIRQMAREAYALADTMLIERAKPAKLYTQEELDAAISLEHAKTVDDLRDSGL